MWSHGSIYGAVSIGSKIGDFIEVYCVNGGLQEGIFTHREIATDKQIKNAPYQKNINLKCDYNNSLSLFNSSSRCGVYTQASHLLTQLFFLQV